MEIKLQKPTFCKIADIKPASHCYHIYAKILSANKSENTTNNGRVIQIVEGVLADETSSANYRFSGNHTANIDVGKIVAVRNGKSNVVDDHILLELDQFGRVTVEASVEIKDVNKEKNISSVSWEKKPRTGN